MKVLLTGASGFIGSFLTLKLIDEGHHVIGIDNFSDYYSIELKEERVNNVLRVHNEAEILNVDLNDKQRLETLFEKNDFEAIIHLAAQAGVRLPARNYVDSNISGFLNLLDLVRKYSIRNFLFASSSSVYGNSKSLPYREDDKQLLPTSFYGLTKKLNEEYVEMCHRNFPSKMRALRFFTVYGPWGRPDMAYFRLISAALNQGKFELFGDGSIQRDFTFVTDVVDVVSKLLNELVSRNEMSFFDRVNIGGDRPLSMNYLIREIEEQTKSKINLIKSSENVSDSRVTAASRQYLTSLIGEVEYVRLEDGIAETVNWANSSGVRSKLVSWVQSSK